MTTARRIEHLSNTDPFERKDFQRKDAETQGFGSEVRR